jgi:hypothetical protein
MHDAAVRMKNSTVCGIKSPRRHVCARLNINDALTRYWNQSHISGILTWGRRARRYS